MGSLPEPFFRHVFLLPRWGLDGVLIFVTRKHRKTQGSGNTPMQNPVFLRSYWLGENQNPVFLQLFHAIWWQLDLEQMKSGPDPHNGHSLMIIWVKINEIWAWPAGAPKGHSSVIIWLKINEIWAWPAGAPKCHSSMIICMKINEIWTTWRLPEAPGAIPRPPGPFWDPSGSLFWSFLMNNCVKPRFFS